MEETISLKEVYVIIKKRLLLIITITVVAALISGIVSFFVLKPVYSSAAQVIVNQATKTEATNVNSNDIQASLQLINTYNVIIKSKTILEGVIKELDLKETNAQLKEKITVSSEKNSQVISIAVQDNDPKKANDIANTVANVFKTQIGTIMKVDNVSILEQAELSDNPTPIKPNKTLNVAISAVLGLMIGIGLVFLLEYLDNTLKSEEDIARELDLPLLGSITVIGTDKEAIMGLSSSVKKQKVVS